MDTTLTAGAISTAYITPSSPSTTKLTLLTNSSWIRDNTRADIDYLYTKSGSLAAGDAHTRVIHEIAATLPPLTDTTALDSWCAGADIYWPSLIETHLDPCRDHNLIAFASYTGTVVPSSTIAAPLYLSGTNIQASTTSR